MLFGDVPMLNLLRVSFYIVNLVTFYFSTRLTIIAISEYKISGKSKTAGILLATFASLFFQSLLNIVIYTADFIFDVDIHTASNLKNLLSQSFLLMSLIGFWKIHRE